MSLLTFILYKLCFHVMTSKFKIYSCSLSVMLVFCFKEFFISIQIIIFKYEFTLNACVAYLLRVIGGGLSKNGLFTST